MPHPSYAHYFVKNDTFQIMLMPGFMPGYGIVIYVTRDSANVYHFANPKGPQYVFKSSPSDSSYTSGIRVGAISSKVVLAAIPKKGEPIEGIFTYEGDTFYRKNEPADAKNVVNAKGKFFAKFQAMD